MVLTSLGMWLQDGRITSYRDFHCKTDHRIFIHFYWEMFVAAYFVIQMVPIFYCVWTLFSKPPLLKVWFLQYVTSENWTQSKIFATYKHGLYCKDHANLGLNQAFAIHSYCRFLSFGLLKKPPKKIPQKLFSVNIFGDKTRTLFIINT